MKSIFFGVLLTAVSIQATQAATITAASCSQPAVRTAVNEANDGDIVVIPDGSCSWTAGVSTSKQIWIRAEHYTFADEGRTNRSVIITNNSTEPLFALTTGNSFNVGLSGIRFNEGSGLGNHLRVQGSGSKVAFVSDNYFEVKQRNGNATEIAIIYWSALGGVLWNNRFVGVGGGPGGQVNPDGASILIKSIHRAWETPSTMGALDTGGATNVYFEDNSCQNVGQFPDVDDNGRVVFRHNDIDGCSGLTHGFTSAWGGRHVEYYDNTFRTTTPNVNIAGRYFWLRGGTGVWADNVVHRTYQGYGNPVVLAMIVEGGGTYPKPRQVGRGNDGSGDVPDPVYLWNLTGTGGDPYQVANYTPEMIQQDRDFLLATAKPGWTRYAYPHPLRQALEASPSPPTNLRVPN